MSRRLYTWVLLPLLVGLGHVLTLFKASLRRAFYGRYATIKKVRRFVKQNTGNTAPRVWIHAASMGEFEHVKPLIRRLHQRYQARIIVSFFSPSGYNHVRAFTGVGLFVYLPFDFPFIWKKIFQLFQPAMLLISKHDVWPNQIHMARKAGIYCALVNASLSHASSRTSFWVRSLLSPAYRSLDDVFAISPDDALRLQQDFGRKNVTVVGDTKFDQVLLRQEEARHKNLIDPSWHENARVLIYGSIWPQDARHVLAHLKQHLTEFPDLNVIIAPHDITDTNLKTLLSYLEDIPYRLYTDGVARVHKRVIIINTIGLLADMYKYGDIAYVGGSFKQGIHNVMEPAIYGLPVLFGPRHTNSFEAQSLLEHKGALLVQDAADFDQALRHLLQNADFTQQTGEQARIFAHERCGATAKIMTRLSTIL
ncbi:MAG: hypothetical protein D6677_00145 [Calditrichaeota bacterium]|nr:MAG: hypothetical protein D6677_00145 [Calditrichota bacterium]